MWPPFEPTAEQREIVYNASGFGLPQTDICCLIKNRARAKASIWRLRKHFAQELERAPSNLAHAGMYAHDNMRKVTRTE